MGVREIYRLVRQRRVWMREGGSGLCPLCRHPALGPGLAAALELTFLGRWRSERAGEISTVGAVRALGDGGAKGARLQMLVAGGAWVVLYVV